MKWKRGREKLKIGIANLTASERPVSICVRGKEDARD
jgi:hypothetical protein